MPVYSRLHRQSGRYADTFRWGFARGFRDALRLVGREVDAPHMWAVLDRLADRYELAGSDG